MAVHAKRLSYVALALVALAFATAASGEQASAKPWAFRGNLDLTFGFKPQFVEADGAGHYASATATVVARKGPRLLLSLSQGLLSFDEPDERTALVDPILAATIQGDPHSQSLGFGARAGLSLSPGLSLASRDDDMQGTIKASLALQKQFGPLGLGMGAVYARKLYRYTRAASGQANDNYTLTGSLSADYAATAALAISLYLAYAQTRPLAGGERHAYSNGFNVSYDLTEALTISTGLSTSDAQLSPGGDDNNEFTLYKRNQTEMYVSASHAI